MDVATGIPRELGYGMQAEWRKHGGTWLAAPHNSKTWLNSETGKNEVPYVADLFMDEAAALSRGEKVYILTRSMDEESSLKRKLKERKADPQQILFYRVNTVDVWTRDYMSTFVTNPGAERKLAMVDWTFDSWGQKYVTGDPDDRLIEDDGVPALVNSQLKLPRFRPDFVCEGGSIDVNGEGTLLTTEECLLEANYLGNRRNPNLSREDIELTLKDYLNLRRIIWLKRGILGDDTDGHVDDIARFVNPTTVLCAFEDNEKDGNYPILRENYDIVRSEKDQDGKNLEVVKLPMPGYVPNPNADPQRPNTKRLPASYANFYIGSSAVIVPTFDDPNDAKALGIIGDMFPGREIVGLPARVMVMGLGTYHCATQQEPMAA